MVELHKARNELHRLQGTERTLFKQLVEIRAVIKTQKSKIDELIKRRPPAINRLPVELLSKIILHSLPTYDDPSMSEDFLELADRRINLSMVSRLWRKVILGTPEIWSDIVVCSEPPPVATLETQLMRSGIVPLNIFIINPYRWFGLQWLDVLVSAANRWRCLHIKDTVVAEILRTLEGLKFPSLEEVLISALHGMSAAYPRFLLPSQAPALVNLKLENLFPTPEFATATALRTLELGFRGYGNQTMNPTFIPTQSLTDLSLAGDTSGWMLLPDSLHFPLLEVFKLAVNNSQPFMKAIVAPKLMCFDYSDNHRDILQEKHVSFGTGSKFSHVQRFTLDFTSDVKDGDALCQEFCGVRDVGLHANTIHALFLPEDQFGDSDSVPADHWTSLESLTIYGSRFDDVEEFDPFLQWLTKRLKLGWPRLSVRLSGLFSVEVDGVNLRAVYSKLQTCSNPEVEDIELSSSVHCSTPNELFQLDLSGVEAFVADDMFWDCRIPSKCSMKTCIPLCT